MTNPRVARGRKTQWLVADRIRHLYPDAAGVPASLPGRDVLHTPGLAVECKAVNTVNLPGWLRQACKNAGDDLPVVVHRPPGFGPVTIDQWAAVVPLGKFIQLLEEAGYGQGR